MGLLIKQHGRAKLIEKWNKKDSNGDWLKTLKTNDPAVINTSVHMAVDVYNDSMLLTLSAWSWPSSRGGSSGFCD